MGQIKKTKIYNPHIVTDLPPSDISEADIGRLWVDTTNNNINIALHSNDDSKTPELRTILDNDDMSNISNTFYKGIDHEYKIINLQEAGDTHYDYGYDFFTDTTYLEHATQETDDFYSFYYKEVEDTDSPGYLRSLSTDDGVKHVRMVVGSDTYNYNDETHSHVNYSKIITDNTIKSIIDITFDNKDILTHGYIILPDKKTILVFCDPEGFFIGQKVKIRYLI